MKRNLVWCTSLVFLLGFSACGTNEENSSFSKGKIRVDLGSDVSFADKKSATRATDLSDYEEVNNYTVELLDGDGAVMAHS